MSEAPLLKAVQASKQQQPPRRRTSSSLQLLLTDNPLPAGARLGVTKAYTAKVMLHCLHSAVAGCLPSSQLPESWRDAQHERFSDPDSILKACFDLVSSTPAYILKAAALVHPPLDEMLLWLSLNWTYASAERVFSKPTLVALVNKLLDCISLPAEQFAQQQDEHFQMHGAWSYLQPGTPSATAWLVLLRMLCHSVLVRQRSKTDSSFHRDALIAARNSLEEQGADVIILQVFDIAARRAAERYFQDYSTSRTDPTVCRPPYQRLAQVQWQLEQADADFLRRLCARQQPWLVSKPADLTRPLQCQGAIFTYSAMHQRSKIDVQKELHRCMQHWYKDHGWDPELYKPPARVSMFFSFHRPLPYQLSDMHITSAASHDAFAQVSKWSRERS